MRSGSVRGKLMFACAVAALTLSGCDKDAKQDSAQQSAQAPAAADVAPPEAALPLATGAAPASTPAPVAAALPQATPISYESGSGDRYAYLDRAYTTAQAFGDAPPDYTYDYEQQQPLAWRSDDGYERVAEPLPGGGLRYYYYQPGAQEPYLVQDPDYSYAYSDGALVVVYDAQGRIISDDLARRQAGIAARYLARARALYAVSLQQHHEAVAQAAWVQQQERVYADRQRWREQQDQDAAWHAYHDAHLQDEQAHWAMERYRRAAEANRFAITINNTVIVERTAKTLQDSSAEARRLGHDVKAPPPAAPASPGPAAPVPNRPVAPSANPRPQPPAAAAPARPQHAPAPAMPHAGALGPDRPHETTAPDNRRPERAPPAQVAAPVAAPPVHATPPAAADHARDHQPDRAPPETRPVPPNPARVMPARPTPPTPTPVPVAKPKPVAPPEPPREHPPRAQQPAPPQAARPVHPAGPPPPAKPAQAAPHAAPHPASAPDDAKHPHDRKKDEPKPQ